MSFESVKNYLNQIDHTNPTDENISWLVNEIQKSETGSIFALRESNIWKHPLIVKAIADQIYTITDETMMILYEITGFDGFEHPVEIEKAFEENL